MKGKKHTLESVLKISKARLSLSPGRKRKTYGSHKPVGRDIYRFIGPSGELLEISNLCLFCDNNNLDLSAMYRVHKGDRKVHRGYIKAL